MWDHMTYVHGQKGRVQCAKNETPLHVMMEECGALQHPFTSLVVGPTGSGKTRWLQQLLQREFIEPKPSRIVWCYAQWQPIYNEIQTDFPLVEFIEGLPDDIMQQWQPDKTNLLILDDLMARMDERVSQLYTQGSHHLNLSVVTVLQNLFPKGKDPRTVSLNAHYIILFKNPRDCLQVATLGAQMHPGNGNKLLQAYKQATREPYSYMLIDLKQNTPDHCRLRTNIFNEEPKVHQPVSKSDLNRPVSSQPKPSIPQVKPTSRPVVSQPEPTLNLSQQQPERIKLTFKDSSGPMVLRMLNPHLLDWNEHGEMIAEGHVVGSSSLTDLIDYLLKPHAASRVPEGWPAFLKALEQHQLKVLDRLLPDVRGNQIVEQLSPIVQSVAEQILRRVGPTLLSWNRYWRACLFGKIIPDSNIVQLFQFALSRNDPVQPVGLDPFLKAIKAGGITTDYLVNPRAVQVYKYI